MINRTNYLITKEYLKYLDDVYQLDRRSIERYWFYLKYLLLWADDALLSDVAVIRPTFATFLTTTRRDGDEGSLAPATLKKVIQTVKRFFTWVKLTYPREYRNLSTAWIDTLRPPRSAQPAPEHTFVSLDEVRHLVAVKVSRSDLSLWRDQVGAVMLFLSGMRAGAFCTLPISAMDLSNLTLQQWPSLGVETKNGKAATTYLLDIPELLAVVEEWDTFIRSQLPPSAMWYTPIISRWGEQTLSPDAPGKNRNLAVSKRMRKLFDCANLPYKSPHKFRHGHAVYALQHAKTMADYKAVSMNLMHEDIRVTDSIYAPLAGSDIQQRIAGLTNQAAAVPQANDSLTALIQNLPKDQLAAALMAIAQQLSK
jgi:integrase